jgi:hypothetical protein
MASHASKRARGDRSRISTAVLVNELDQNDAQSAVERELVLRLASLLWRFVGAFLFSTTKARHADTRPQKSRHTSANFGLSDWPSPFFLSGRAGTKVKNAHHQYFTPVRQPNDCCPRKRHVWGTRQSRWFLTWPAALLCVNSAFLCSRSHRAKSIRYLIGVRLTSKGRW